MAKNIEYEVEQQQLQNNIDEYANATTATTPNNNTLVVPISNQQGGVQPISGDGKEILVSNINYKIKVDVVTTGTTIYLNGDNTFQNANSFFNVKLSDVLAAPATVPYTITIKKNGYSTIQRFVFVATIKEGFDYPSPKKGETSKELYTQDGAIILNIYEYVGQQLLRTQKLQAPKYDGTIFFNLELVSDSGSVGGGTGGGTGNTTINTKLLTIVNNGLDDSVILLRNGKDGIKLKNGTNTTTGNINDVYTIKSNDLSRYAISKWALQDTSGVKTERVAAAAESLSINLTINSAVGYTINLTVAPADVMTLSKIPLVVVNNVNDKLKYNINSKQDYEINITKNQFVDRVTVYIANEIYQYNGLDNKQTTAVLKIPFFAFKQLGTFSVVLVPSSITGDGDKVNMAVVAVDDEFIPVPDLRRIKYPSRLYGPDYKGTDVDFSLEWESINTNFVRIYVGASTTANDKFLQVASNGKITLNVSKLIQLNPSNYLDSAKEFKFQLTLVPYNTTGRDVVTGKSEILPITFVKSLLVIPKTMAINRIAEAFAAKFDTSLFQKETSKYLTHNLHFASNIDTEVITTWTGSKGDLIVKLYEPLPGTITKNEQVWISKLQSTPIVETITLYGDSSNYCIPLKGPNFALDTDNGIAYATYNDLIASGSETSNDIINKYVKSIGIDTTKLSIQYVSGSNHLFENFVNFSSAEERFENFFYKVGLIQNYKQRYQELSATSFQAPYEDIQGSILVQTTPTHPLVLTHEGAKMITEDGFFEIQWEVGQFAGVTEAKEAKKYLDLFNGLINNLDGWERFLYNDIDNPDLSYPKELYIHPITGLSKYILKDINDPDVIDWYNYTKVLTALYDKDNVNNLTNNIPEYIINDYENNDFILFLNMIGQHFDILWTYINSIKSTKLLEEKQMNGISNSLISNMLKSFGWDTKKAFQSQNLWEYAFGKDKDGYTKYGMSLEEANNQVWRRILNNLPYLLKHKGTARAMKAIMACYGVPQSMLTIMEFGGPQEPTKGGTSKFTFEDRTAALYLSGSLNASGSSTVKIPWHTTSGTGDYPNAIEVRILPAKYPNPKYSIISGSEWSLDLVQTTGSFGKLELNFGGDISDSTYFNDPVLYSGDTSPSVTVYISPEASGVYAYGPDLKTGSLDFPISLTDYSQVIINRHNTPGASSWFEVWYATSNGKRITTFVSMSLQTDDTQWQAGSSVQIGGNGFQGTIDEFRLWEVPLKRSKFENHTLFPNAINGNSYTASTADLIFRLDFEKPKNRKAGDDGLYVKDKADPYIYNVAINRSYGEDYAIASNMQSAKSYPYQYIPYDRDVTADVPSTGFNYSNKIRFESSSLMPGKDLSYKHRATKKSFDQAPIDSNRLGIFLSPIKELNMDILKAFGDEFNIDNYIGDPSDDYKFEYTELATLRKYYFDRFDNRDIYEYIQLVKYIDKSLFDVLDDLAPGRAKVSKGLLIEPHFLERSKTTWTKPKAERGDYTSLINASLNTIIDSYYNVEEGSLDAMQQVNFSTETPFYDGIVDAIPYSELDAENLYHETLIDYNQYQVIDSSYPTYPETGSININCIIEASLEGTVDSFESTVVGMDKNSLANAGYGLYANSGNAVVYGTPEPLGFSDWKSGSRASVFLVKEQYTKYVKVQVTGYPTTRSLTFPGEQVSYAKVPVTKYKYRVSNTPFSSSISLGGATVQVTALNGYFPTHYKYVNNLSEGMQRSFWKGSKQELINGNWTTPDSLPAVETFYTNANILRVAKTGRGSGEPILEVD
jgi:hypothetical protein